MLKIGDFSRLSRISIRMLRHYDSLGLLVPERVDPQTGYRYYAVTQLTSASRIQQLKEMGFGLSVIGDILVAYHDSESLKKYLTLQHSQLCQEAQLLNQRKELLERAISHLEKENTIMKYDVTVKEYPEMQVLTLRKVIPAYEREGDLWQEFYEKVGSRSIEYMPNGASMAIFYDEGFKETDVDVEICVPVTGCDFADHLNGLTLKVIPAVPVASVTFQGDYSHVASACEAIGAYLEAHNLELSGPQFNIYRVNPGIDPDPSHWITEVCFPIK